MNDETIRKAIGERIKTYRETEGLTREKLAEDLGMSSAANLGHVERGAQYPTLPQLQALVRISNIPYEHWLEGKAYYALNDSAPDIVKEPGQHPKQLSPEGNIMLVPLVNQYAYAGYVRGFTDATYLKSLPTIPFIVDKEYKGKYLAFEIRGDSMDDGSSDSILEGDIALCREIRPELWTQSKLHIKKWDFLIVEDDGIILKRITEHNVSRGSITCHSLNDQYEDFNVQLKNVNQIFNVVRVERKK